MARGMVAVPAGDNVLRLLPPLIIEQRHVDEAIGTLQEVFQDFAGREAAQ
jgi:acetylornithine/N-succinyldiaminopimelate aminotransferase